MIRSFFPFMRTQIAVAALFISILFSSACFGQNHATNAGTNFWFGFTGDNDLNAATYAIDITSFFNTTATVSIPLRGYTQTVAVTAGTTARLVIPTADVVFDGEGIQNDAVHVTSTKPISLYYSEESPGPRCDNTYVLPDTLLGNEYYVMSYNLNSTSEFMIVPPGNSLTVDITPTTATSGGHAAGVTYTVTIASGQVYQVRSTGTHDLTGTRITLDPLSTAQNFAVIGATDLGGAGCVIWVDGMFEELFPINTWGKNYIFGSTPRSDDLCRILASQNSTHVKINGTLSATLNAGQYFETTVTQTTPAYITADNPVSVGRILQTGNPGGCNNNTLNIGDPSLSIVNSNEQMFLDSATFYSDLIFVTKDYVQIVLRSFDVGSMSLDNVPIPATSFTAVAANPSYSYADISVASGSHSLTTTGCGFLAYFFGMGGVTSTAADAGVFLQPIMTESVTATPSNCSCSGTATVTVTGGFSPFTYQWSNGASTATVTGLCPGTYTAIVQDKCATSSDTDIVTVTGGGGGGITAAVAIGISTCSSGGSATASGGGGTSPYTYSWSDVNSQTTATATGLSAGNYTVTITDKNGCSTTAIAVVPQPSTISATTSFIPATCNNANGSASVAVGGGVAPYTYLWTDINSQTTATATGLSAGSYTVTVTDNGGCSATASVTIPQPVTVSVTTSFTQATCNNANGSASAVAINGSTPYTYLWSDVNAQTTATATGLSAGSYTVTVTDNTGCSATSAVTVTQPPVPTATTTAVTNELCNGGNTGSAIVTAASGSAPYTYIWSDPNSQTTDTARGLTAGNYTVTVTDNLGCTATASVLINQPPPLTVSAAVTTSPLCNGGSGSATATVTGGTSPYGYSWSPIGGNTAVGTGLTAGGYTVTVTDANGCSSTAAVTVTQPLTLTTALTVTNVICFGGNDGSISTLTTGGTQPYAYLWSNGQIAANATNLTAGTYSVRVTDANGCTATGSATVSQNPPLTISASASQSTICIGRSSNLSASGGVSYVWAPSAGLSCVNCSNPVATPAITTTYTVIGTDANGCKNSATVEITVIATPPTLTVSAGQDICPGQSATLRASGNGISYNWEPGNNTNSIITVSPATTTTWTVTSSSGCGTTTGNVTVFVNAMPNIRFSADVASGCAPFCVQFRNLSTLSSGNIIAYNWTFGTGDTSHTKSPTYCYSAPGAYSVSLTATSDSGCSSTLNSLDYVTVFNRPNASFIASPQPTTILQPTIQFTNKSTDRYGVGYLNWNFGDASDSASQQENPSHTYHDTGTYCPTLTVMNIHGCADSVTDCIVIDPIFALYVPSAFTPNGDGLNEMFMPKGNDIKSFEMYVFDRWGMEVFHSTDINNGWDGTLKGSMCQADAYVYSITIYDSAGNKHNYTGTVNLLK